MADKNLSGEEKMADKNLSGEQKMADKNLSGEEKMAEPSFKCSPFLRALLLKRNKEKTPQELKRSALHARKVPWMRKPEYISTSFTRYRPQPSKPVESIIGFSSKTATRMDVPAQIDLIERTFADVKKPLKHPSNPKNVPVEILPIYPDFLNQGKLFSEVIFHPNPILRDSKDASQCILAPIKVEPEYVGLYRPTESTKQKLFEESSDKAADPKGNTYEFDLSDKYEWKMKNNLTKGFVANNFFVVRSDGIFYNEMNTRVFLNRRRPIKNDKPYKGKLVIKHSTSNKSVIDNRKRCSNNAQGSDLNSVWAAVVTASEKEKAENEGDTTDGNDGDTEISTENNAYKSKDPEIEIENNVVSPKQDMIRTGNDSLKDEKMPITKEPLATKDVNKMAL